MSILIVLAIVFVLMMAIFMFLRLNPQFGAPINDALKQRYSKSPQWKGKIFENRHETVMDIKPKDLPKLLRETFSGRNKRGPQAPLPVLPMDANRFQENPDQPKFVWYGHSALLLQLNGKNILIDPMLGPDAAPIAPFPTKRYSENVLDIIDTLPPIDLLLMTHDHYDHLDYASIKRLRSKVDTWFVALGVGRHLERWGIPSEQITEFDWWDSKAWEGIELVFTPSRHFSGRGPTDRAKSLWGGWVFLTEKHRIYWSGDGGYDDHFQEVGERYGPFDWGFMECGQYDEKWHLIHMYPEEAVQAALDAKVKVSMPVHWGGFTLALHPWKEPVERFVSEANAKSVTYLTPELGQIVALGDRPAEHWWESLE